MIYLFTISGMISGSLTYNFENVCVEADSFQIAEENYFNISDNYVSKIGSLKCFSVFRFEFLTV